MYLLCTLLSKKITDTVGLARYLFFCCFSTLVQMLRVDMKDEAQHVAKNREQWKIASCPTGNEEASSKRSGNSLIHKAPKFSDVKCRNKPQ